MELRERLLEHLATPQAETRFGQSYLVKQMARSGVRQPHEVWEALWGLVAEGLVYLDPGIQGPDNWNWRLSRSGIEAATGGAWEPRDPRGYLRRLRQSSPGIDSIAIRYVEEALRAFNARCYLASSVMLGVASERVVEGLARVVSELRGDRAKKLRTALDNPRASQLSRFQELRKQLEPMRPELPDDLGDTLTLDAVANLLRLTRNEAGHPTGAEVGEDTAYTHLQMAAIYLQKMTALQEFLAQKTETD